MTTSLLNAKELTTGLPAVPHTNVEISETQWASKEIGGHYIPSPQVFPHLTIHTLLFTILKQ
jgi:hypothetical protein